MRVLLGRTKQSRNITVIPAKAGIQVFHTTPQKEFINPEILSSEGESVVEEGCLSIPGVREEVKRPEQITLSYMDEDGNKHEETFAGWMARVLQHEIDHLNGVLFVDHISPVKKQLLITQDIIPSVY